MAIGEDAGNAAPLPIVDAKKSKSIILFSDGTGNSSAKLFKTNVWRMYEAVDLGLPRAGQNVQIAYYDNGIGTSKNKLIAVIGGIFGFGLQRNVLAIYRFVCRNYRPGDKIYAFGFSRGAFTIRLVAALLASRGVVSYNSEAELNARTRDVLHSFQRKNQPNLIRFIAEAARRDRDMLVRFKRMVVGPRYEVQTESQGVKVEFLGVWDTVAAYGGPSAEITRAIDNFIYPLTMTDHCLNKNVQVARHALAIDDERDAFHPVLWDEKDWHDQADDHHQPGTPEHLAFLNRLQQVWFAGMHSDVGGGYPDESLSYVSLLWMIEEAQKADLRLLTGHVRRIRNMSNSLGPIHNSRGGLASYYRYQPRKMEAFFHRSVDPNTFERTKSMRDPLRGEQPYPPEGFLLTCKVHESVAARIALGTDDYAPITLPKKLEVVEFNSTGGGNPRITPELKASLQIASDNWASQREALYDRVWCRRVVYFWTVFWSVLLVSMPLYAQYFMYPRAADDRWIMERLTSWTHFTLPNLFQPWVKAFETSPILFWVLVAFSVIGWLGGRRLEGVIQSGMRRLWKLRVATPAHNPPAHSPSLLQRVRNCPAYQGEIQDLKWYILPVVAGLLMLLALFYTVLVIETQTNLSFAERDFCTRDMKKPDDGPPLFDVSKLCNATEQRVVRDHQYAVEFAIPKLAGTGRKPWKDGNTPTDPAGIAAFDMGLVGYLGAPLRRLIDARYLQPLYEIRPDDDAGELRSVKVRQLQMTLTGEEGNCLIYRADFTASEDGLLFLFANDVFAMGDPSLFYDDAEFGNKGTARVHIHDFSDIRRGCTGANCPTEKSGTGGSRCEFRALPKSK